MFGEGIVLARSLSNQAQGPLPVNVSGMAFNEILNAQGYITQLEITAGGAVPPRRRPICRETSLLAIKQMEDHRFQVGVFALV